MLYLLRLNGLGAEIKNYDFFIINPIMSNQDIYEEEDKKLLVSLNQALKASLNGEDVDGPLAKEFKHQMENNVLQTFKCPDSNSRKEQIIRMWIADNRADLKKISVCSWARRLRQFQR
jgi:hypothetical protein